MTTRLVVLILLLLSLVACQSAPTPTVTPVPTATRTPWPAPTVTPLPTPTLEPSPTATVSAQAGQVEGLVMMQDGELILGVNWLSKSRITYVVKGGDVDTVKRLLGETARLTGLIVDKGPFLKEITVRAAEVSAMGEGLSMRAGYIKELGPSIYMQGSHVLMDREGNVICLLASGEGGPDLDRYMMGKVVAIGVMTKTVEGNAQIMTVQSVEPEP